MKNQSLAANVMKISIEDSIHKVMDIMEEPLKKKRKKQSIFLRIKRIRCWQNA